MNIFKEAHPKGLALTVVMMVIIMLVLLAAYILNFTSSQKKVVDTASGYREVLYYRAQAGIVDANWRIRTNAFGVNWANPATRANYSLDVDGNGTMDVDVDIQPVDASGLRKITANGRDST